MSDFSTTMKELEIKYQKKWSETELFNAEMDPERRKFFVIWAYPGVSGYLHVGHMRGYTFLDAIARYKRMQGYNVLFPVGAHASGLPTVGFSLKVKNKEKATLDYLLENGCPPDFIPKLADPLVAVEYFSKEYVKSWLKFGFSIDPRYFINTISPEYQRFIEWQFAKLHELDLLVKKPHYAPWCPVDGPVAVDPSETDISKGGNAEQLEFILIKFATDCFGDQAYFMAATLRPETVYGVTNIWLNPEEDYALIEIEDEKWIVSKTCVENMKLGEGISVLQTFTGSDFIGKYVYNMVTETKIPILPGSFVDSNLATGVVMSVPAHAPFDWIALQDLKATNQNFKDIVNQIQPISIIQSSMGDIPAEEVCKKHNIQSQHDVELLKIATEEVYRIEFHKGIIKVGDFKGIKISTAKEPLTEAMIEGGLFSPIKLHEFSEEVICRCGSRVGIRMIPNQWFIRYSDIDLKEKTKNYSEQMEFYPKQYKTNIKGIIDWYDDRACARQGKWLGTPFPYDKEWTIEPIADSTLYPIFFLVAKYVNNGDIATNQLTYEFFDYVFLDKGSLNSIAEKLSIDKKKLKEIKDSIEYWYPLDINLGGKEHQTVHFPVFLMNHVAILKPSYWPKSIFVNYWVSQFSDVDSEGIQELTKLSKSKGGAKPVQKYNVDGLRFYYTHSKSAHQDVEWNTQTIEIYEKHLSKIYDFCNRVIDNFDEISKETTSSELDKYLQSKTNRTIVEATEAFEQAFNFRKITQEVYYNFYSTLIHYLNRGGNNFHLLKNTMKTWITLMCPFTPHLAEEIWSRINLEGFVSNASWPEADNKSINLLVEAKEEYVLNLIADINNIQKVRGQEKISHIDITITPKWKEVILSMYSEDMKDLISRIMKITEIKEQGKKAVQYAQKLLKSHEKIYYYFSKEEEFEILTKAKKYIEKQTDAHVEIYSYESSESPKKDLAEPLRPAIYIK